eukprot:5914142-Prymnesium_polylepis.1
MVPSRGFFFRTLLRQHAGGHFAAGMAAAGRHAAVSGLAPTSIVFINLTEPAPAKPFSPPKSWSSHRSRLAV